MEIAVLMKVVPDLEHLRFDPVRRAVVRDGVELLPNAFDQRALRVALELARASDSVRVLSLGPPGAVSRLQEARALGAHAATLLTDPAFAGSDVFATARALARGLGEPAPPLIITGARSLDSDTGLVAPELAEMLARPALLGARAARRDGDELEVTVDAPDGSATLRTSLPALLSVGEKITKPLRLSEEQAAAAPAFEVRRLGPADLGLAPSEVGAAGSPTSVVDLDVPAPSRRCRFVDVGTPEARVRAAFEALGPFADQPADAAPVDPAEGAGRGGREVAVVVTSPGGGLARGMLGWLSEVRRSVPSHAPVAVALGASNPEETESKAALAGAAAGITVGPGLRDVDGALLAQALAAVARARPRIEAFLLPTGSWGQEGAGRTAARLGLGAVGDATEVAEDASGALLWRKPSFGGRMRATIRSRSDPTVATVAPYGAALSRYGPTRIPWETVPLPAHASAVRRLAERSEPISSGDPGAYPLVVAVGTGVGGSSEVEAVVRWAGDAGVGVVGTRRVVDAGWLPARLQVGVTGRALAPRLAVLLGVRGSAHHMSGWRRAERVLALNQDPQAPVFADADVGLVGKVEELWPALRDRLAVLAAELGRA